MSVTDRYSVSEITPPLDISNGGSDNIITEAYTSNNTHHLVQFSRNLNTGDNKDKIIKVNGNVQEMSFAYGGKMANSLAYHKHYRDEIEFGFPSGFNGKINHKLKDPAKKIAFNLAFSSMILAILSILLLI